MPHYPHEQEEEDSFSESDVQQQPIAEPQLPVIDDGDTNFGFNPMADPREEESKKRKLEETSEMVRLKAEIQTMLCRYPKLVPRTSHVIMEKLDNCNELELRNVYQNCLNDIRELRGCPAANGTIFLLTKFINDWYLPGYTDECLRDQELSHDIESELTILLGMISNKVNIVFRFLNNAYTTYTKRAQLAEKGASYIDVVGFQHEYERTRVEEKKREDESRAAHIIPVSEKEDASNQKGKNQEEGLITQKSKSTKEGGGQKAPFENAFRPNPK